MRIGFAKIDITPRVGVPLCGFGPFLNRVSTGIRDRLWARAMVIEAGDEKAIIIACDLVTICIEDTERVRTIVHDATGVPGEAVLINCSHTHSGPDTSPTRIGWGGYDPPYMELLPGRIAKAAIKAFEAMREATFSHAEVPCEGIGLNRVYDSDSPPLDEVLRDEWRPAKPELTDTSCHVFKAEAGGALLGFVSYFGCHPVCCCAQTRYIHGDYAGIATNLLEREHPGSVGLFLQGAEGDVNSCVVHKPEQEALLALDIIASRYAGQVRAGIDTARPIDVDSISYRINSVEFSHRRWSIEELRERLAQEESVISADTSTDEDRQYRMAVVRAIALRRLVAKIERGDSATAPVQLQGIRVGPIALLASPFETFQAIKNDVVAKVKAPIPLVLSVCNDARGYAFDRIEAKKGGYASDVVPMIHGYFPYANIHDELVKYFVEIENELAGD